MKNGISRPLHLSWFPFHTLLCQCHKHIKSYGKHIDQLQWHQSRGRGDRSPRSGVEGTLISIPSQSFCLLCAFVHVVLWDDIIVLSPESESIKLAQSGPGYSSALGLGPQTLLWIYVTDQLFVSMTNVIIMTDNAYLQQDIRCFALTQENTRQRQTQSCKDNFWRWRL